MRGIDVDLIREAAKQIAMAAYVLTDSAVIEALRVVAGRGVKVRIWRDASMAKRVGDFDVEAQFRNTVPRLEARANAPGGKRMHLKGYYVDHRLLRTGSANFSRSDATRRDNDLASRFARRVRLRRFDAKFDRVWARG